MQNVKFYIAAPETVGSMRDYANAKNGIAPTLVRGVEVCLKMRLFANSDGMEPYPMSAFANIVSWQWAMDKDFNEATKYILEADNSNITVSSVMDNIDGTETEYTEFSIPISQMNTVELATWLGTDKSKNGLAGELVGFGADGKQVFILQVENFTVRNRITSLGSPTPINPDYLTAEQVRALIAAGIIVQFSADRTTAWHDVQMPEDRYIRVRSATSDSAEWSAPIGLVVGPQGEPGVNSFCYVAYAVDANGAEFSLTPSNALKYRAEIHVTEEIIEPVAENFTDAVWVKYLGDDGTGVGDMLKSTYDTDDDGIVDNAEHAANADAVPWTGVSGKPETFIPAVHTHTMDALTDPVRQKVVSGSNPATLYLDSPVLMNSAIQSGITLALDFTAIKDKAISGAAYSGKTGDFFTWEYHITCSLDITGVTVGSMNSTMVGISIPETLPRINNANTTHVFVVRGIYKSGAVNNLKLQVNYAYSYEA